MEQRHYVGLDISLATASIFVIDNNGAVVWRGKCATEPDAICGVVRAHAPALVRVGLETGQLSNWLTLGLRQHQTIVFSPARTQSRNRCSRAQEAHAYYRFCRLVPRQYRPASRVARLQVGLRWKRRNCGTHRVSWPKCTASRSLGQTRRTCDERLTLSGRPRQRLAWAMKATAVTIVAPEGTSVPQECWKRTNNDRSSPSLTAQVISGYVSNNRLSGEQLPELIRAVYNSLSTAGAATAAAEAKIAPKVEVKKSVFADRIVCLACGASFSMLKRHLNTEHQLTPAEYRERYELPRDYPLVVPDYAKVRSRLAKKIGLGVGGRGGGAKKMAGRKRR
jgi:predicted transcriptional regulator